MLQPLFVFMSQVLTLKLRSVRLSQSSLGHSLSFRLTVSLLKLQSRKLMMSERQCVYSPTAGDQTACLHFPWCLVSALPGWPGGGWLCSPAALTSSSRLWILMRFVIKCVSLIEACLSYRNRLLWSVTPQDQAEFVCVCVCVCVFTDLFVLFDYWWLVHADVKDADGFFQEIWLFFCKRSLTTQTCNLSSGVWFKRVAVQQ